MNLALNLSDSNLTNRSRREIADLVTKGRIETARLRVETLIGDDIHVSCSVTVRSQLLLIGRMWLSGRTVRDR